MRIFFRGRRPAPPPVRSKPSAVLTQKKAVVHKDQSTVKVQPKPVSKEVKVLKEEIKKPEVTKKETESPFSSQLTSGHSELNTLMTGTVAAELRDLMTSAWQALSEAPSMEAECFYFYSLRNEVRRHLRNVLGLNITKRLLNVYNPLQVKVQFSGKPEVDELRKFLKKYNFTNFSRKSVNIFDAQVKTIDDFDRLCKDGNVKCGNIQVKISSAYEFTTCPNNLKTKYKYTFPNDKDLGISLNPDDQKSGTNVEKKPLPEAKRSPIKPTDNGPVKEEAKQENAKPKVNNTNTNEVKQSNQNITLKKPNPTETKTMQQNITKVVSPIKVNQTKNVTQATPKTSTDATPVNPTKVTPKVTKKPKVEDDYDELDDHDILALMSEGIILDECSGSNEE